MKKLILLSVFGLLLGMQSVEACSINAAGSCGGSECTDGKECTKVSVGECKCVKPKPNSSDEKPAEEPKKAEEKH